MLEKNAYDRNVNTFSNQGLLYQVEYAMKAVEQGCTTLKSNLKWYYFRSRKKNFK